MWNELPIFVVLVLICSLLYWLTALIPARNRTRSGCFLVCAGWITASALTYVVWQLFLLPGAPFGRNWGLGGVYLFLAVYPASLLLAWITVSLINRLRKESHHD